MHLYAQIRPAALEERCRSAAPPAFAPCPARPAFPAAGPPAILGFSLGVYEEAIASCQLGAGEGVLVRLPAVCRVGASTKQEIAAPPPELGPAP